MGRSIVPRSVNPVVFKDGVVPTILAPNAFGLSISVTVVSYDPQIDFAAVARRSLNWFPSPVHQLWRPGDGMGGCQSVPSAFRAEGQLRRISGALTPVTALAALEELPRIDAVMPHLRTSSAGVIAMTRVCPRKLKVKRRHGFCLPSVRRLSFLRFAIMQPWRTELSAQWREKAKLSQEELAERWAQPSPSSPF
jgi:hypothetical protein